MTAIEVKAAPVNTLPGWRQFNDKLFLEGWTDDHGVALVQFKIEKELVGDEIVWGARIDV